MTPGIAEKARIVEVKAESIVDYVKGLKALRKALDNMVYNEKKRN